jgi:hypothetical protein
LPAPLLAVRGRWRGLAGARTAARSIGRTTLAFTLGHSVALAVTALTRLQVPAWPVESFIAASILVGAVHAIRPIFPRREAAIAGLFGLGHGLAFSFALADLHLSTRWLVLSLLGFNLGIELVQLLLVALAMPPLIAIARLGAGPALRMTAATATGVAATGWLADRLGWANPIARAADDAGGHPTAMTFVLAAATLVTTAGWIVRRRSTLPVPTNLRDPARPDGRAEAASDRPAERIGESLHR